MLAAIACGAMSLLVISISSVLNSSQMIGKFSLCDLCVLCASVVDSLTVCSNREQNRKHRGRTIAALQNIVALELESIGGGDEETVRHLRPLKRFPQTDSLTYSELKLGVNERDFARRCSACRSYPKLVHLRDSGELLTWHDGRAGRRWIRAKRVSIYAALPPFPTA
jgi:hypothetical protein